MQIWNVPYRTHCTLLRHMYEGPRTEAEHLKRVIAFYNGMHSSNPSTRMCGIFKKHQQVHVQIEDCFCQK